MTVYKEPLNWVEKALYSISDQNIDEALELVLVIDNPNYRYISNIKHIVQSSFDKNIIIVNDVNKGLVESLNIAFSHATGNYIARMDCDDISFLGRFNEELTFLKNNNLDFVASSIILISEEEHQLADLSFSGSLSGKYLNCVQGKQNQFWHPTWLMKRKVMKDLHGYRAIPSVEDYDFVLRALSNNFRLGLLGKATVKKRFNRLSISEMDNYRQSVYTQWLLKKYNSGEQAELKNLPVINKKKELRFYEVKKMLATRKKMTIASKVLLLVKMVSITEGRYILKSIFVQRYQIKGLNFIKKILMKLKVGSSDADY
ncbi:glycosyltransferase [Leuconostoc mesenteroides]|uniref:glycosyltransferase n=1 Tax=Leuconostoc mesenteroides TaxID=1245 RepID=UPI0032DF1FF6